MKTLPLQKIAILFILFLSTIVFLAYGKVAQASTTFLATNAAPTYYPLAPCPSCSNPSLAPTQGSLPTSTAPTQASTVISVTPQPCTTTSTSIASHPHHHHHHHKHGALRSPMDQFLKIILELINKLLKSLGLPPIQMPDDINNPDDTDNDDTDDDDTDDDDTDDDDNPCIPSITPAPTAPGVTTVPQPTTTVPSARPSTIVPSTVMPSIGSPSAVPSGAITGCTQADIQKLVDSVSQANIEKNLKALVQDDTKPTPNELVSRHVSAPGNQIKVDWAKQQMTSTGLQIVEQPFTSGGRNLHNLVARINGTDQNSFYVVGGHIDSISENPATTAPGADDDGSGVVVAMEVGRVMKTFERCLKSSIDIAGWNDEEEELNGSPSHIKALSGKTIKGAIAMDMIGYQPTNECLKSDYKEAARDQALAQKLVDMNTKYNVGFNVSATQQSDFGDDAASFWDVNIPAAYLIECTTEANSSSYPGYHKTTDTTKNVNFSQLTKTAKLIVAALAELASQ